MSTVSLGCGWAAASTRCSQLATGAGNWAGAGAAGGAATGAVRVMSETSSGIKSIGRICSWTLYWNRQHRVLSAIFASLYVLFAFIWRLRKLSLPHAFGGLPSRRRAAGDHEQLVFGGGAGRD